MKSYKKLIKLGIEPDKHPAIIGNMSGSYSKDLKTLCLLIDDSRTQKQQENFENLTISKELLKEIAQVTSHLITNFGLDIHSHTLKSDPILSKLKITKISTL